MAYIFGSIWDRFNRNALNNLSKSVEQQGKSIQDLVAKGQLTPTQYKTLIESVNGLIKKGSVSVYDIDVNQGKLLPKHMSQEVLKMIAGDAPINAVPADGSLTTQKYANKSVTENKTNFFKQSRNLFSGEYKRITTLHNTLGIHYRDNLDSDNGRTAVVELEPNEKYTVSVHGSHDRFILGVVNDSHLVDGSSNKKVDRDIISNDTLDTYTFTNNSSGKLLLVGVSYSGQEPLLQIEKGEVATKYVAPYIIPEEKYEPPSSLDDNFISTNNLKDASVTPDKTSFMVNDNLFNGVYLNGMILIESESDFNTMYTRNSFSPWDGRVAVVPVKPNKKYTFKIIEENGQNSNVLRVGFASSKPTFNSNRFYLNGEISDSGAIKKSTVESRSDSTHLVIYLSNNGNEPVLVVSEGEEAKRRSAYISPEFLPDYNGGSNYKRDFMPVGHFTNDFKRSEEIDNWTVNVDALTLDQYYQLYEELRSQNPNYISRKIIGYAGTSDRQDDTTLPIYEYEWNERMADNDIRQEKPLLLVQSLIHGNERLAGYNTYLFFKNLADRRNSDYDFIRDNYRIKLLAVASPYSFKNNIRKTASGVDPNRNYASDWSFVADDGNPTGTFPGNEPMSEKETQYIDRWLSENQEAIGFIDTHNVSGSKVISQGQVSMCWLIARDDRVKKMAQLILSSLSRKWYEAIPELSSLPSNTNFGYVNSTIAGTTRNHAYVKYGIPSITIDPCWTWEHVKDSDGNKVVSGAKKNDKNAAMVSNDVIGSVIFGFIKWFS